MFGLFLFMVCIQLALPHMYDKAHSHTHNVNTKENLGLNPEEHMNVSEMIQYFGYPVENHEVVTEDGYILTVQRIPHGRNGAMGKNGVVYLQHGMLDSSTTWVINLPHQSLGFMLADQGYDVWLGNMRGNTYGKKHVHLSTDDAKFWKFSFDEMAKYDLPAIVDYILKHTGEAQLNYVGHSQGTMIAFIELGRNDDLAKKIKSFHALAPVSTVGHIKGGMKELANYSPEVKTLYSLLGFNEFMSNNWFFKIISEIVCALGYIAEKACGDIIFIMIGFDEKNFNMSRVPIYTAHTPAGTSVQNAMHYVQMIKNGKFQMYDYGHKGNVNHYNQTYPPQYDLTQMTTPVALYTGSADWLADPYDVKTNLIPNLRNIVSLKNIDSYNHLDFVWGKNANSLIYEDIIKSLSMNG